jgi:signal peptidase
MFWVEAAENWHSESRAEYYRRGTDGCADLRHCPAPHAGYVTLGDNNERYDQTAFTSVVRPEWVVGVVHPLG